jgi:hypothetical protein
MKWNLLMVKNKIRNILKPAVLHLVFMMTIGGGVVANAGGVQPLPDLQKAISEVTSLYGEKSVWADKQFQVQKFYYQIQSKSQKLKILNEVKDHFEKAVVKAEENFNSDEGEVSQSAITKLKLGLAGTLNDIVELESQIKIARLSLALVSKNAYSADREMSDLEITPVEFSFKNYAEWFKVSGLVLRNDEPSSGSFADEVALNTAYLKSEENQAKLGIAKNNRKITRALLVSEVANYDFGIGDPADLFEALIIYTRVLSGYYDSVYNFNLAVADLNRTKASWIGIP